MTDDSKHQGCLDVETITAHYRLCFGARLALRSQKPAGATTPYEVVELRGDGAAIPLLAVLRLQVGEPMLLLVEVLAGVVTARMSTPVQSVSSVARCPSCQLKGDTESAHN